MKLILSEYLRTLKERKELDVLLPKLLLSMGIIPSTKTQIGTRQFGVDLAAVGKDPDDEINKLFLFIIKRGDLGRSEWDSNPQSIRQSLGEIFDVYIDSQITPADKKLPLVIVLATSGDMKEEINPNWSGYANQKRADAQFSFWGADKLAFLIEKYLMDENIFSNEDATYLRRALALAGENDYSPVSLYSLFQKQLGLDSNGQVYSEKKTVHLGKNLSLVALSTKLFIHWAAIQENLKQGLFASERALLWSSHRIKLEKGKPKFEKLQPDLEVLWQTYKDSGTNLVKRLQPYYETQDGISCETHESALLALLLFEHIGLLASMGLAELSRKGEDKGFVDLCSSSLESIIENNPASGSPRLDENVIDINLGLMFLMQTGKKEAAHDWLQELVLRIDFAFRAKSYYPVNSTEELLSAEAEFANAEENDFVYPLWMIATLADWCIFLDRSDLYSRLAEGICKKYPAICHQLWHPTANISEVVHYFATAHMRNGSSEAPISFPPTIENYKRRIEKIMGSEKFNHMQSDYEFSSEFGLDIIACRHFRTLLPPVYLYRLFLKS